jgi:hypothetical protein
MCAMRDWNGEVSLEQHDAFGIEGIDGNSPVVD